MRGGTSNTQVNIKLQRKQKTHKCSEWFAERCSRILLKETLTQTRSQTRIQTQITKGHNNRNTKSHSNT
jgi:hypothetical protein